jgi:hypothetical protein
MVFMGFQPTVVGQEPVLVPYGIFPPVTGSHRACSEWAPAEKADLSAVGQAVEEMQAGRVDGSA